MGRTRSRRHVNVSPDPAEVDEQAEWFAVAPGDGLVPPVYVHGCGRPGHLGCHGVDHLSAAGEPPQDDGTRSAVRFLQRLLSAVVPGRGGVGGSRR
jgi:hypothetical protein